MKEKNNLLGKVAYVMAFISYLEGVKKVSNLDLSDLEFETLKKEFQKIWFKVQIISLNKVNDETISETSNEILKIYFG